MNLIHLKYFFDAARLRSLSASARENFVSQSAVSQGILALEKSLRCQLLTHTRNKMRLTATGERVFAHARGVFRAVSELQGSVHSDDPLAGELRFGCTHSIAQTVLLEPLAKLPKQITPVLRPGHIPLVAKWVAEGEVEFGLVLDTEDFSQFDQEVLMEGTMGVFSKEPIEELTECLLTETRPETLALQRQFKELRPKMRVSSWQLIAELVNRGVAPGFLPDFFLSRYPFYRFPTPLIPYRLLMIKQPHEPLSLAAKQLLALC